MTNFHIHLDDKFDELMKKKKYRYSRSYRFKNFHI